MRETGSISLSLNFAFYQIFEGGSSFWMVGETGKVDRAVFVDPK